MNTTISDAAVSAACMVVYSNYVGGKRDYRQQCDEEMRDALEAALPHLQPNKPEAVRLRDELRERAEFEAAYRSLDMTRDGQGYSASDTNYTWSVWQAALAATGKQQVGEVQRSVFLSRARNALTQNTTVNKDDVAEAICYIDAALAARQPVGEPVDDYDSAFQEADRSPYLVDAAGIYALESFLTVAEEFRRSAEPYIEAINEGACGGEDEVSEAFDTQLARAKEAIQRSAVYAAPPAQAVGEPVARLIEAVEGECDGLAVNNETAAAILAHVFPLGQAPAAYMVDGRMEQGLFFDKVAAENMAAMNAGDVVTLFRQPAQAVDLGQFREAVENWHRALSSDYARGHIDDDGVAMAEADRLLALIDGQAVQS